MTAVHQYMQKLVQGTPVSYGAVLFMPPTSMPPWMPGGLDWYGLDIYDWPQFHFPNGGALDISGRLTERLNSWLTVVRAQTGLRYPKLNICETNSAQPSSRAKWFTALGQWLNANGGHRMLTFWSDAGCGPWLPDDTATIEALRALAALQYAVRPDHTTDPTIPIQVRRV